MIPPEHARSCMNSEQGKARDLERREKREAKEIFIFQAEKEEKVCDCE